MQKSSEIVKKIKKLETKRQRLLTELLQESPLAVGSLGKELRRCGNPTCHCAETPTHKQFIFHYTNEEGKRTSRFVRRVEEDVFEEAAARYKKFRQTLRELKHLDSEIHRMCGALKTARAIDPKSWRP